MKQQHFVPTDFEAVATLLEIPCDHCDLPIIKEWTITVTADGRIRHGNCGAAETAMDEWPQWFKAEDKT